MIHPGCARKVEGSACCGAAGLDLIIEDQKAGQPVQGHKLSSQGAGGDVKAPLTEPLARSMARGNWLLWTPMKNTMLASGSAKRLTTRFPEMRKLLKNHGRAPISIVAGRYRLYDAALRTLAFPHLSSGQTAKQPRYPSQLSGDRPMRHSEAQFCRHLLRRHPIQPEARDHLVSDRTDAAVEVYPGVDDFDEARVRLSLNTVTTWQRHRRRVQQMIRAEAGILADGTQPDRCGKHLRKATRRRVVTVHVILVLSLLSKRGKG